MTELKPCPFCGSNDVELIQQPFFYQNAFAGMEWYVNCTLCTASSGNYSSDHDAVNAWNRRDGEQE